MKVKVLTKFKDRYTKKWYAKGDVIEVTEERYNEILEKGKLVEAVKEPEEPKPGRSKNKN